MKPPQQSLVDAVIAGSGMPPTIASSFVNKTGTPGRYAVETDMSMAGAWRLEVRWDGPSGKAV